MVVKSGRRDRSHPYLAIAILGVAPILLLVGGIFAFVALTGDQPVGVPSVTGLPLTSAKTQLEAAGLRLGSVTERTAPGPPNLVLGQTPTSAERVPPGSAVALVVSAGTAPAAEP